MYELEASPTDLTELSLVASIMEVLNGDPTGTFFHTSEDDSTSKLNAKSVLLAPLSADSEECAVDKYHVDEIFLFYRSAPASMSSQGLKGNGSTHMRYSSSVLYAVCLDSGAEQSVVGIRQDQAYSGLLGYSATCVPSASTFIFVYGTAHGLEKCQFIFPPVIPCFYSLTHTSFQRTSRCCLG